jgi:hypothetical protein
MTDKQPKGSTPPQQSQETLTNEETKDLMRSHAKTIAAMTDEEFDTWLYGDIDHWPNIPPDSANTILEMRLGEKSSLTKPTHPPQSKVNGLDTKFDDVLGILAFLVCPLIILVLWIVEKFYPLFSILP